MDYELLDFGAGRKLERFGPQILDRPSPAAETASRRAPQLWPEASARYERTAGQGGRWLTRRQISERWSLNCGEFQLELKPTEVGHLGVFPEQASNWQWIRKQVQRADHAKVLNLFAYTGASTLAAAAAGAEVVHVDSAANVVDWARRNSAISGLCEAPIRWIVEDALKFVERELRRGNHYDAVLLDPPAYGHGPKGQTWKLAVDLPRLLPLCFELCSQRGKFLLLSCHTAELADANSLLQYAGDLLGQASGWRANAAAMALESASGGRLNCGAAVRWVRV
jgi:23S rRNA (cytosine1962-C5)-methyltransferase